MSLQKLKKSSWMILFIRIDPSCVNQVRNFFLFFFSCLFSASRFDFVFIFLFSFIFFCFSWYLIEIKIYNNQLDQGTSPPSPYLTCFYLVLMLHINFLLSFHSRHILMSIIFNIEDNVWFRFGGMYIDFYLFVLFCSVVLKKKIFCLAWGLCFEFVILLLLKEFHCFHAQFIAHARSHSNTTCWMIKMIRKSWW